MYLHTRFMAMAGIGTGMLVGPLAVQARFSQPANRNAVVSALTLFVRTCSSDPPLPLGD